MSTAFLTYRHENARHSDHATKVLDLGLRLRKASVTVILDQLANKDEFNLGGPPGPNGWAGWSYAQVEDADKVLIIGSAEYFRTYEDKEAPGKGLGAAIEAQRIFAQLYKAKGKNPRFRVVILSKGDDSGIPDHLRDYHCFYPNRSTKDFNDLVSWINGSSVTGCGLTSKPLPVKWPPRPRNYQPDLANRDDEFAFVESMLSGKTTERAVFFEAPTNHGKTLLIAECSKYASQALPHSWVSVDFKGNSTREFALDTLKLELADRLPNFRQPDSTAFELRADLRALSAPVAILFDTYEKASSEARELVEGLLLADIAQLPAVRLAVAGQIVPEHQKALWSTSVRYFKLGPIADPIHWRRFAERHHAHLSKEQVDAITLSTAGIPGVVRPMLSTLAAALK